MLHIIIGAAIRVLGTFVLATLVVRAIMALMSNVRVVYPVLEAHCLQEQGNQPRPAHLKLSEMYLSTDLSFVDGHDEDEQSHVCQDFAWTENRGTLQHIHCTILFTPQNDEDDSVIASNNGDEMLTIFHNGARISHVDLDISRMPARRNIDLTGLMEHLPQVEAMDCFSAKLVSRTGSRSVGLCLGVLPCGTEEQ